MPTQFPGTAEALSQFDVVVLSDIGANSLQLAPGVFDQFRAGEDRLVALRDWVNAGGSLMMIDQQHFSRLNRPRCCINFRNAFEQHLPCAGKHTDGQLLRKIAATHALIF